MVPCPSFAEKLRVLEREDKHTLPFGSGELHHRPHLEDPGKLLRLNPYSGCPADNGDVRARGVADPVAGAGIGIVDSPYREGPRPELRKPSLGVLESEPAAETQHRDDFPGVGQIDAVLRVGVLAGRSEERRVGKECRSRWSP